VANQLQEVRELQQWRGHQLVGGDGEAIGKVKDIYIDRQTGRPEWLAVSTGMFGSRVSFVPLSGATTAGDRLAVRWSKDEVKHAPNAEADGELSPDEEIRLYEHYRMGQAGRATRTTTRTEARGTDARGTDGDSAMTRSEEELRLGTSRQQRGQARLHKWVETEHVEESVPVRREQARVEREPITDANRGAAMSGPEISEAEHEVTLFEERPIVEKDVVPRERVRLEKEVVTDEQHVEQDLRKERIDVDEGDTSRGAGRRRNR
jgi:uncharacterized protein (TIGR02271 family)